MKSNVARALVAVPGADGVVMYVPDTMATVIVSDSVYSGIRDRQETYPLDSALGWLDGEIFKVDPYKDDYYGLYRALFGDCHSEYTHIDTTPYPRSIDNSKKRLTLILFLTKHCNCRCSYCTVDTTANAADEADPTALAHRLLGIIASRTPPKGDVHIHFYGGEPLSAFSALRRVVDTVQRTVTSDLGITWGLSTNGTLVSGAIADFLDSNRFSVEISIDGDREVHDRYRRGSDGYGTFESALAGAQRLLCKPAIRVTVSVVITRFEPDLIQRIEQLRYIGFTRITTRYAKGAPFEPTIDDLPRVAHAQREFADSYRAQLAESNTMRIEPFYATLCALRGAQPFLYPCGAGSDLLCVSANDGVYPCAGAYCTKTAGSAYTSDSISTLRSFVRPVSELALCRDCWARYLCGGPCPLNAISHKAYEGKPLQIGCLLAKIHAWAALGMIDTGEEN